MIVTSVYNELLTKLSSYNWWISSFTGPYSRAVDPLRAGLAQGFNFFPHRSCSRKAQLTGGLCTGKWSSWGMNIYLLLLLLQPFFPLKLLVVSPLLIKVVLFKAAEVIKKKRSKKQKQKQQKKKRKKKREGEKFILKWYVLSEFICGLINWTLMTNFRLISACWHVAFWAPGDSLAFQSYCTDTLLPISLLYSWPNKMITVFFTTQTSDLVIGNLARSIRITRLAAIFIPSLRALGNCVANPNQQRVLRIFFFLSCRMFG